MPLHGEPQPDARRTQIEPHKRLRIPKPEPVRCMDSGDHPGKALWSLFARTKYTAAKKSPREPGQRPADLRVAAELLREALEATWRAGFKSEDLAAELLRLLKGR